MTGSYLSANYGKTDTRRVHDPEADLLTGTGGEEEAQVSRPNLRTSSLSMQYCDHGSHVLDLVEEDES